ncbi:MAG: hypothetical protein E7585_08975 [Ruminococcaceae bacterium]|nr:hypothetical protein [Oscillospiraceae bacterium]
MVDITVGFVRAAEERGGKMLMLGMCAIVLLWFMIWQGQILVHPIWSLLVVAISSVFMLGGILFMLTKSIVLGIFVVAIWLVVLAVGLVKIVLDCFL